MPYFTCKFACHEQVITETTSLATPKSFLFKLLPLVGRQFNNNCKEKTTALEGAKFSQTFSNFPHIIESKGGKIELQR